MKIEKSFGKMIKWSAKLNRFSCCQDQLIDWDHLGVRCSACRQDSELTKLFSAFDLSGIVFVFFQQSHLSRFASCPYRSFLSKLALSDSVPQNSSSRNVLIKSVAYMYIKRWQGFIWEPFKRHSFMVVVVISPSAAWLVLFWFFSQG